MSVSTNPWGRRGQVQAGNFSGKGTNKMVPMNPGALMMTGGGKRRPFNPTQGLNPMQLAEFIGVSPDIRAGSPNTVGGQLYGQGTSAPGGGGQTVRSSTLPLGGAQGAGSFNNNLDFQAASTSALNGPGGPGGLGFGGTTHGSDTAGFTFANDSDKAYSPGDISAFLQNPQLFQQEYLSSLGLNNPTSQGAMGEFYRALPALAEFYAARMAGADASTEDQQAQIMEELLTQYTTPGGRTPDAAEILSTLLGIGNVANDGLANNMLQALYAGTSPENQMSMVGNLWEASIGGNPTNYGNAMSEQMERAKLAYQQQLLNANNGSVNNNIPNMTFTEFLRTNPLFRRLAGM